MNCIQYVRNTLSPIILESRLRRKLISLVDTPKIRFKISRQRSVLRPNSIARFAYSFQVTNTVLPSSVPIASYVPWCWVVGMPLSRAPWVYICSVQGYSEPVRPFIAHKWWYPADTSDKCKLRFKQNKLNRCPFKRIVPIKSIAID